MEAHGAAPDALSRAWYGGLTEAYRHGVLGDALEPTMLHGWSAEGCAVAMAAGPGHVFEDIAPRLADVTGDGRPELVAVRSSLTQGAQLVIYELAGSELRLLAATPPIGRRFRWLAPAAIADLDGDGAVEIAYVDRPHLARTLRIWRYADGVLRQVAALAGVTNHRIGEATIPGGLRVCGQGPEIVLATADWTGLVAARFDAGALDLAPLSHPATAEGFAAAMACR